MSDLWLAQSEPDVVTEQAGAGRARLAAVVALLVVASVVVGFLLGSWRAAAATPSDTSAEAGFARDMQAHHGQAVQMALAIRDRTTDPALRTLTYDIITSQQQQSGQMFGWLAQWGLSQTSSEPSMAWMSRNGAGGHDMGAMGTATPPMSSTPGMQPTGGKDGMATAADVSRLSTLPVPQAETLFLRLMITHHQGGVAMAKAVQPLTDRPEVLALAGAIVQAQTDEITALRSMLAMRGA